MSEHKFQIQGIGDPRLAIHAASGLPVWLWSPDGTRIIWTNPVGAAIFAADNAASLADRAFGPADPHRRQIAQLYGRLPAEAGPRLERLRGLGAPLGRLVTCACARLTLDDGTAGLLIAAAEPVGRPMPLIERLRRLVEGIDMPIAAFARDGMFIGASEAARPLMGFRNLSEAGLDQARGNALRDGRAETPIGIGHVVLQRVGSGADIGLVALLAPGTLLRPAVPEPPPVEAPAVTPAAGVAASDLTSIEVTHHDESPTEDVVAETGAPGTELSSQQEAEFEPRASPLRFVWHSDADARLAIDSAEWLWLVGFRNETASGQTWSEISETIGLDPAGRVAAALAGRGPWSGITLHWPVTGTGGETLALDMAGVPVFDREGQFAGFRGFGICHDVEGMARVAALRRDHPGAPPSRLSADVTRYHPQPSLTGPSSDTPATDSFATENGKTPARTDDTVESIPSTSLSPNQPDNSMDTPQNVVPFRPPGDARSPSLTPTENNAFDELARQLSARLDSGPETNAPAAAAPSAEPEEPRAVEPPSLEPASPETDWLAPKRPVTQAHSARDKLLLDLLPTGILIYRLDRLLYANRAFLDRVGYGDLDQLEEAGGLDALYIEPSKAKQPSTHANEAAGTAVAITTARNGAAGETPAAAEARLHTIAWDGETALALIMSGHTAGAAVAAAAPTLAPPPVDNAEVEELAAILDAVHEGVVTFDSAGRLLACNRGAETMFGGNTDELMRGSLADLFTSESRASVQGLLDDAVRGGDASRSVEVMLRHEGGDARPVSLRIGRSRPQSTSLYALIRDLSDTRRHENELAQARRTADRAGHGKADVLARISHEVRTPLNAIIGFAEVMIDERFGALGNERYVEYMKDIRASGERVIAIIDDLLDLSRIETGKLDFNFAGHNLNDLIEHCVGVMQPQANRERIIIRTSLAHSLPQVVADATALRQIVLNLIGGSIHLAKAGGQVIVSTALSDFGDVVLHVRDTGHGLNEREVAAAMEPFRSPDEVSDRASVSLSLTKALVEANRAQFAIKPAPHSGTLIEVVFAHPAATTR